MSLTIRIDSLRQTIRANERGIEKLVKEGEEGITQVATLQLMRELETNILEFKGQNDEPQTTTYDSALLRSLGVPIKQQLLVAETLANLQVKASEAKIAGLTAVITKGRQTILLGDVQRKTRLLTAAQPHAQALKERLQERWSELKDSEPSIFAPLTNPDDKSIIVYQKTFELLEQRTERLNKIGNLIAKSATQATVNAKKGNLPDFAIDAVFQSGLIQGVKSIGKIVQPEGESFITNLAVRLAQQIKFV